MSVTNEKLVEFLQQIIHSLEHKTYTKEEFLKLVVFYIQAQPINDHEEFQDEAILKYALLGWYISSHLDDK